MPLEMGGVNAGPTWQPITFAPGRPVGKNLFVGSYRYRLTPESLASGNHAASEKYPQKPPVPDAGAPGCPVD